MTAHHETVTRLRVGGEVHAHRLGPDARGKPLTRRSARAVGQYKGLWPGPHPGKVASGSFR